MKLGTRFDLARLAKASGDRRAQVELVPILPRRSLEADLLKIIARVLAVYGAARQDILRAAVAARSELTTDAPAFERVMEQMRASMAQVIRLSQPGIRSLFEGDARRHDETWMQQVNRVIGVDLRAVVQADDLAPIVELTTQANVALIRGLSEDVARRIETQVIELVSRGASTREIAKTLGDIGGFGRARAKLIAGDQAAKFNSVVNQARQEQAGVTSYVWNTSRDERVRPLHRARQGRTFRWDSPPSDGHPGRPIRCRCVARAVLDLTTPTVSRARREGLRAVEAALAL